MTGRALWIELRRSTASWAFLCVLGLGAALVHFSPDQWAGRWIALAAELRLDLLVLWPIALGFGAWQAGRDRRTKVEELFGTTARPQWRRVLVVGTAPALGVATAYLLVFASGVVQVAPTASYAGTAWAVMLAVGTLSLMAAVWIGMGIGRLVPSVLVPPAVVVLGGLAISLIPLLINGSVPVLRDLAVVVQPTLDEPLTDVAMVSWRLSLAQILWFAALAGTGLALVVARDLRARGVALLPVAVAAAVAAPVANGAADEPYTVDRGAAKLICAQGTPRVCVAQVHAAALPGTVGPAQEVLAKLAVLPNAPVEAVEERTADWMRHERVASRLSFDLDLVLDRDGRVRSAAAVTERIAWGAGTRLCLEGRIDWDREWTARAVAEAWLLGTPETELGSGNLVADTLRTLRSLPEAEQRRRVAAFRAGTLTCDRDLLSLLTTGQPTSGSGTAGSGEQ